MNKKPDQENVYNLIETAMQEASAGNYVYAEQILLQSYVNLQNDLRHNSELRGQVFHLLANNYRDRGKLKVARDFYEKALQVFDSQNANVPVSLFEDMYYMALREGDFETALQLQKDLYIILQKADWHPHELSLKTLLRLSAISWQQLNYRSAQVYLKKYLELSQATTKIGSREFVSMNYILGLLSLKAGESKDAEDIYRTAISMSKNAGIITDVEEAEMLNQLGMALCGAGKHVEAQAACKRAGEIRDKLIGYSEDIGNQFRCIASCYCSKDNFEQASVFCLEALEVFEKGAVQSNCGFMSHIMRRLGLFDDAKVVDSPQLEAVL